MRHIPATAPLLPRRPARTRRAIAGALAVTLLASLACQAPAMAAPGAAWHKPKPKDVAGVKTHPVKVKPRPSWTAGSREFTAQDVKKPPTITGDQIVDLTTPLTRASVTAAATGHQVGRLPVYLTAAPGTSHSGEATAGLTRNADARVSKVRVTVLDAAGQKKVGFRGFAVNLSRADGATKAGTTRLTVDYTKLAGLFGADAAGRLQLVRLSDGKPLPTTVDAKARTVTATVALAATGSTAVGLAAAAQGSSGDYTATSLSAASTWQVTQQTGAFTWSYPIKSPTVPGDLTPSLELSYNSGSVDSRTSGTNTQSSGIGDGWDMWPGFIERTYRACADDKDKDAKPNNTDVRGGDLCYFDDNATISFNGHATDLVKVGPATGNGTVQYRGAADDGSKIEMLVDGRGNGDTDGTYWRVTTTDGTQYYFGRNTGTGGSSAGTKTNSVFTAPVYSNNPGEPGYETDFAKSRHDRGWRWNLDYIVDPKKNDITYFYSQETGAYAREGDKDKRTTYDRGGYLIRAEYGSRSDDPATAHPVARIAIDNVDRCVGDCYDSDNKPIAGAFPDTPWEQYCDAAPCKTQYSPTFWTQKRVAVIHAQVYSGSGDTYRDADVWTLDHTYLSAGVNDGYPLWLKSITHSGPSSSAGGPAVTDPPIVFDPNGDVMANRVDTPTDGHSSLYRSRISTITTETGAQIGVTYKTECTGSDKPDHVWTNTMLCYPQWYGAPGEDPTLDWFHKYVVSRVDVYDQAGGSEHQQTNYDYLDKPAWAYNNSPIIKKTKRTWDDFRGFGDVQVRQGLTTGVQSVTEYRYFRGMDGDPQAKDDKDLPPTGTPRQVSVTDSRGGKITDHESFAGMLREKVAYNGFTGDPSTGGTRGPLISDTFSTPEHLDKPSATAGSLRAWQTHVAATRTGSPLANGSTRWISATTTFDALNYPVQVNDLRDESTPDDDTCATVEYVRNQDAWMLNRVKRTSVRTGTCDATGRTTGAFLSDTRTYYDNRDTYAATPTRGLAVRVDTLDHFTGTTPQFATTQTWYDAAGRATATSDELNHMTTSTFTPATGGPVVQVAVTDAVKATDPAGVPSTTARVTTSFDPVLGLPITVKDVNGQITQSVYDGDRRLRTVWAPDHLKASYPNTPNMQFDYTVSNTAASTVTTKTLTGYVSGSYRTNVTLLDSLLRVRQTQTQTDGGGRSIVDTHYDSRGLVDLATNPYYDDSNAPPSTTLLGPDGRPEPPSATQTVYDGASRPTDAIFLRSGDEQWRTHTDYVGERTNTTPPRGGTATTEIADAADRLVELRQYKNPADVGKDTAALFDRSTYHYTVQGWQDKVTDPAGNYWSFGYDLRGHQISQSDPDRGTTTQTFNAAGEVATTTDARVGFDANIHTLAYTYDDQGRRTSIRQGTADGPKLAEWVFDTAPGGIDKLAKSIRYEPAGSTNAFTNEVTGYDAAGRPTGSTITVPPSETDLCVNPAPTACSYTVGQSYELNGDPWKTKFPAIGGLAKENVELNYHQSGLLGGVFSGLEIYAQNTYNQLDQLTQQTLGQDVNQLFLTTGIDTPTGRVTSLQATPKGKPDVYNLGYNYDNAGNVLSITDTPDGSQPTENQCFAYDHVQRLTAAWTPKASDCTAAPTVASLAGPAPFFNRYTYDAAGNRTTEVLHGATDTTRTYAYPGQGGKPGTTPHAVTQVTTTVGTNTTITKTENYKYDKSGNTSCRPATTTAGNTCPTSGTTAGNQAMTWNEQGQLAKTSDATGDTSYIYDADGNRLIRRDPTGTTLYLQGGTELRKPKTGSATATRYYSASGSIVAVRTPAGLTWQVNDLHGTAAATVSNDGKHTVNRQRSLPFGGPRGTVPTTWAGDKGFVGGTKDNTGLTHLGAREYDPSLGKFISADPVMDLTQPTQWNAYAYASNNPTNRTDPGGLCDTDACISHQDHLDDRDQPAGSSGTTGSGSTGSGDDSEEGGEKWYKVWKPRHDTAVRMASTWLRINRPGVDIDNEVGIPNGSLEGNTGWADIVAWGPNRVEVWEVKHAGGAAEAAGPAQLAKYIAALQKKLIAEGDPRQVVTGGTIPELGPEPNPAKPNESITARSGSAPGIVTYKYSEDDPSGRRVPVPVPQPRAVAEGERGTRPTWVKTRPLWQPPVVGPVPAARAPGTPQDPSDYGLHWDPPHISSTNGAQTATAGGIAIIIAIGILLSPVGL